jgi:hypothetical protein
MDCGMDQSLLGSARSASGIYAGCSTKVWGLVYVGHMSLVIRPVATAGDTHDMQPANPSQ